MRLKNYYSSQGVFLQKSSVSLRPSAWAVIIALAVANNRSINEQIELCILSSVQPPMSSLPNHHSNR